MNTLQINHVLKTNPVTRQFFSGVYPVDFLEKISEKPKLIIGNTDTSYNEGKHWILFFFNEDNVEFFDSLGNSPSYYNIEFVKFMKKYAKTCFLSDTRIQPEDTDLCGHYCIYYAHKRCQGYNMNVILNNLPDEKSVRKFVSAFLKNYDATEKNTSQCCRKL